MPSLLLRVAGQLLLLGAVLLVPLVAATPARANPLDPALSRLRILAADDGGPCPATVTLSSGGTARRAYCPDQPAWHRLMAELGTAAAPSLLETARTTGYSQFQLSLEGSLTTISQGDTWERGTEGPSSADRLGLNDSPAGVAFFSRFMVRKGLPFGFELGTGVSYMSDSELVLLGGHLKWSLFEGFRRGLGYLPDFAVRGGVNTMIGDWDFTLTTVSLDFILSKPITLFQQGWITPFVGFQMLWIFADSEVIDLTPEVDAFNDCLPDQSTGQCTRDPSSPALDTNGDGMPDRQPQDDYTNSTTFDSLRYSRQRLFFGVEGRYGVLRLTLAAGFDVASPDAEQNAEGQFTFQAGASLLF